MEKVINGLTVLTKRNKFEKICKMTQNEVKKFATMELKRTHKEVISGDGFLYAQGTFPVLLVAHMDTVHEKLPNKIEYKDCKNIISSPNGIGGDDRCGIYMVLEVVKQYNCSVLFCEDEEIGAVGAEKFIQTELANSIEFNYLIEFDRKGSNDAVFYDCDNKDFTEFICKDFYKKAYGSFSDISVLAPFFGVAAVNLSCGYYNAHTKEEYVVFSEMEKSIEEACKILDRTTENSIFEYVPCKNPYANAYGFGYYGIGGGWYDESDFEDNDSIYDIYGNIMELKYFYIEYVDKDGNVGEYDLEAYSMAEAVGIFLMDHPELRYGNIMSMIGPDEIYIG